MEEMAREDRTAVLAGGALELGGGSPFGLDM